MCHEGILGWGGRFGKEEAVLFLKKKNQKNFAPLRAVLAPSPSHPTGIKVSLLLFRVPMTDRDFPLGLNRTAQHGSKKGDYALLDELIFSC
jgi:hypothetical protein